VLRQYLDVEEDSFRIDHDEQVRRHASETGSRRRETPGDVRLCQRAGVRGHAHDDPADDAIEPVESLGDFDDVASSRASDDENEK